MINKTHLGRYTSKQLLDKKLIEIEKELQALLDIAKDRTKNNEFMVIFIYYCGHGFTVTDLKKERAKQYA